MESEFEARLFNPSKYIPPVKWLVDDLIPLNSLSFVISQAGVGKSWLVEYLATCVSYNKRFLDMKTMNGDVLVIDQDTPTDVLHTRFKKFIGNRPTKNKLFVESMKGYTISDKLVDMINDDYKNCKLVIIDSLHSISGHINVNDTQEMGKLSILKQNILTDLSRDVSLVVTHHTSEKVIATLDETMTSQTFGLFTMGSSIINQVADNIFLLASPERGRRLRRLYVRPVAKRFDIKTDPIKTTLIESNSELYFKNEGAYEKEDEVEKRIFEILKKTHKDLTVKEIYDDIGLYGINQIRETLRKMISERKVKYYIGSHNLHKFASLKTQRKKTKKKLD